MKASKVFLQLIVILLLASSVFNAHSQDCDNITLKDGSEIKAIVKEVRLNEIAYKKCNFLDGPLFLVAKSEVFMIKYKNGDKEVFKGNPLENTPVNKPESVKPPREKREANDNFAFFMTGSVGYNRLINVFNLNLYSYNLFGPAVTFGSRWRFGDKQNTFRPGINVSTKIGAYFERNRMNLNVSIINIGFVGNIRINNEQHFEAIFSLGPAFSTRNSFGLNINPGIKYRVNKMLFGLEASFMSRNNVRSSVYSLCIGMEF